MDNFVLKLFPIFFIGLWLLVTTLLGVLSGWFSLVQRYPDRAEQALLKLRFQSGLMGPVSMSGILNFDVCTSGLRIGVWRIFGPFQPALFVPWKEIAIKRKTYFFWKNAELRFGNPSCGRLEIRGYTADLIADRAAGWPEAGPIVRETPKQALVAVAKEWAVATVLMALFFIFAPRLVAPNVEGPPIVVAMLFPAIVLGVISIIRYIRRIGR